MYVTLTEVASVWRALTPGEVDRAEALIPLIEDSLRLEARRVGKDIDVLAEDAVFENVLKSVIIDVIARTLMTSTSQEPMIQSSESALGYSQSGTFLVPGGGLFIKNSELARLGLRRQGYGTIEPYGTDYGGWPYGES